MGSPFEEARAGTSLIRSLSLTLSLSLPPSLCHSLTRARTHTHVYLYGLYARMLSEVGCRALSSVRAFVEAANALVMTESGTCDSR